MISLGTSVTEQLGGGVCEFHWGGGGGGGGGGFSS